MLLAVRARVLGVRLVVGRVFVTSYSFAARQWDKLNSFSIKVQHQILINDDHNIVIDI